MQVDFGGPIGEYDANLLEEAEDEKEGGRRRNCRSRGSHSAPWKGVFIRPRSTKDSRIKASFSTSIHWAARRNASPHEIVQFDAGFDYRAAGVGYRYGVRTWRVPLGEWSTS